MPKIPTNFIGYDNFDAKTRLGLDQDGNVESTGRQKDNIFKRAWSCLTRDRDTIENNKATTRHFLRGIDEKYGRTVARMASRELRAQLEHGRPLTTRRVERILAKSDRLEDRIRAENNYILRHQGWPLMERALEQLLGTKDFPNADVVDRQAIINATLRGVRDLPDWSRVPLNHETEEYYVPRIIDAAARSIERLIAEQLMPESMQIIHRDGQPDTLLNEELTDLQLTRMQLPQDQRGVFESTTEFMVDLSKQLADPLDDFQSLDGATKYLNHIEFLRNQQAANNPGEETRLRDLIGLSDEAEEYRDALMGDMATLQEAVESRIGFDELDDAQQSALLVANRTMSDVRQQIDNAQWDVLEDGIDDAIQTIQLQLGQLNYIDTDDLENDSIQLLVESIRTRAHELLDEMTDMRAVIDRGLSPQVALDLRNDGKDVGQTLAHFDDRELELLSNAGLSLSLGLQYKERDVPIHPRTLVGDYNMNNVVGDPRQLSGGTLITPYQVNYDVGGVNRQVVFKEASRFDGTNDVSTVLGIDRQHPRMAVRNVATKAVDDLLGFNLVPETGFGILDGKLGVVMGFAPGVAATPKVLADISDTALGRQMQLQLDNVVAGLSPEVLFQDELEFYQITLENGRFFMMLPHVVADVNPDRPELRRDLVKLQLLDALCGQGDRHAGNYVVNRDQNGDYNGLLAIDNDQAFGGAIDDPNKLLFDPTAPPRGWPDRYGRRELRGVLLPEVVDREMKEAFDRLTPEALEEELSVLLTDDEVEAAKQRLVFIKNHLAQLEVDGKVIEPDQWDSEVARDGLLNMDTSYVARERDGRVDLIDQGRYVMYADM